MGDPEWAQPFRSRTDRGENAAFITERVAAWTAQQDAVECVARLQAAGVPSTVVNAPRQLLDCVQLAHRDSWAAVDVQGRSCVVNRTPWLSERAASAAAAPAPGVRGTRILELTHVFSGPITGSLLGAMGADVVRLEEADRLDLYRRNGPFADGVAGPDRGAYFATANFSKRGALADEHTRATSAASLVESAQVVIENVGERRLARLGVDPTSVAEGGALFVRISGFGSSGPLARYRVYANNVQAHGGIAELTRDRDGRHATLWTVLADQMTSVVTAAVIAAWMLGARADDNGVVDVAMSEVVLSTVAELVAAFSAGLVDDPVATAVRWRGAGELYQATDGRWIAVEGGDTHEIGSLVRRLTAVDATDELRARGLVAQPVLAGPDLIVDEHLAARGFFPEIESPDPDLGRERLVGIPWRFAGEGAIPIEPPPRLGSANVELGLPEVDRP